MHRRDDARCEVGFKHLPSLPGNAERRAEKRLGRRRAEADENAWPNDAQFPSIHGRQAAISRELGFWWMRRFPRGSHLKCLTVFVT